MKHERRVGSGSSLRCYRQVKTLRGEAEQAEMCHRPTFGVLTLFRFCIGAGEEGEDEDTEALHSLRFMGDENESI